MTRSQLLLDRARPRYQEEVLAKLGQNPYNGAYYRLADMLEQAVPLDSSTVLGAMGRSENVFAFEFDTTDAAGLVLRGGGTSATVREGHISFSQDSSSYLVNAIPVRIPKDEIGSVHLRGRFDRCSHMTLTWSREYDQRQSGPVDRRAAFEGGGVDVDVVADGAFHVYEINIVRRLARRLKTGDSIRSLVMWFSPDCNVTIDYIRFVSKYSNYNKRPYGYGYENVGKETRRVLYMLPTQTLQFRIRVPEDSPTLDFGNAVLSSDAPTTFSVTVLEEGEQAVEIYQRTVDSSESWYDARLDLSRWAGREVRLALAVSAAGSRVAFWSDPLVSSEPRKRLNIVLVVEDALRADHLSSYGYKLPTSPVRDSLMEEGGIVFLNAVSQATMTRPSMPSMMTSLLPSATGVWTERHVLTEEYLTLPEVMRAQGFVTAAFVQNSANAGAPAGLHQGYSVLRDAETLGLTTEGILREHAVSWLQRNRERNFFLYLHVLDPHGVYDPPPPFDSWYRENASPSTRPLEPAPFSYLDPEWVDQPTAQGRNLLYDGEIRHNDELLGSLLSALDSLGLRQNTLLILAADHGEYLGEHGLWNHHPPGYLQVIQVPLMFYYPERFPKPKRIPHPVQLIDVMPTILDLAGVDRDELAMLGSSLVDLVDGRNLEYWENRLVLSEEPTAKGEAARRPWADPCPCGSILFRQWHLLGSRRLHGVPLVVDRRAFTYQEHRGETRPSLSPLANYLAWYKHPRVMRELLTNNLEAWRRFTGGERGEGGERLKVDPEVLERLRDLGYINQ